MAVSSQLLFPPSPGMPWATIVDGSHLLLDTPLHFARISQVHYEGSCSPEQKQSNRTIPLPLWCSRRPAWELLKHEWYGSCSASCQLISQIFLGLQCSGSQLRSWCSLASRLIYTLLFKTHSVHLKEYIFISWSNKLFNSCPEGHKWPWIKGWIPLPETSFPTSPLVA